MLSPSRTVIPWLRISACTPSKQGLVELQDRHGRSKEQFRHLKGADLQLVARKLAQCLSRYVLLNWHFLKACHHIRKAGLVAAGGRPALAPPLLPLVWRLLPTAPKMEASEKESLNGCPPPMPPTLHKLS